MKKTHFRTCSLYASISLVAIAMVLPISSLAGDKMQPGEIVAKHLESIGPTETRTSVHSRVIAGTAVATLRSPGTAQFSGLAVMASQGNKTLIGMAFENASYSQERFAFDGEAVTVGFIRPGLRSALGDFLMTYKNLLKTGLIGGTLTDAWPLLNLSEKNQKLEFGGTKKFGGKNAYQVRYVPRGGSDLEISLFFDTETFQHVRTEYTRVISAQLGSTVDASASQRATRYKLIEEFSDFKKESGLMLPHKYKIDLLLDTRGGTFSGDYDLTLTRFSFNQPIEPGSFNVNTKL